MTNIMMTAVGCPGFVEIYNALPSHYFVVGTDAVPECIGKYMVKKFYKVPMGNHPDYKDIICDIVAKEEIDVIVPESTPELIPLSYNSISMISPTESLNKTIDKGKMLRHLKGFFDVPKFRIVRSLKEMTRAIYDLGYPGENVVLKPCIADGSRGLRILKSRIDQTKLFLDKPNAIDVGWKSIRDIIKTMDILKELPEYLVMEYLPGVEYSVDCIPELNVAVVRKRNEIKNGIAWISTVVNNKKLSDMALDICNRFGLKYNINIQFKESIKGNPRIIEINPRVSGTIVACIKAGINLPHLAIKKFLGQYIAPEELNYKTGTLYRYWGGWWADENIL